MGRLGTFLLGIVVGGVLVFGSLNYHLLRTHEGFHLVPKQRSRFSQAYVDIRQFTPADWAERPDLAAAIVRSGKEHLLQSSATNALHEQIDRAIDQIPGARPERTY